MLRKQNAAGPAPKRLCPGVRVSTEKGKEGTLYEKPDTRCLPELAIGKN